jgi:hypothetical protein
MQSNNTGDSSRGCLCKNGTYSTKCCKGDFQNQGIGSWIHNRILNKIRPNDPVPAEAMRAPESPIFLDLGRGEGQVNFSYLYDTEDFPEIGIIIEGSNTGDFAVDGVEVLNTDEDGTLTFSNDYSGYRIKLYRVSDLEESEWVVVQNTALNPSVDTPYNVLVVTGANHTLTWSYDSGLHYVDIEGSSDDFYLFDNMTEIIENDETATSPQVFALNGYTHIRIRTKQVSDELWSPWTSYTL